MTVYNVIRRSDGVRVTGYSADQAISDGPYSFDLYDHIPVLEEVLHEPIFGGRRKLTKLEYRKLLHSDEEMGFDRVRATFETDANFTSAQKDMIRTLDSKYREATLMDLDDPDQEKGLQFFLSLGVLSDASRIKEILNG